MTISGLFTFTWNRWGPLSKIVLQNFDQDKHDHDRLKKVKKFIKPKRKNFTQTDCKAGELNTDMKKMTKQSIKVHVLK